uniref:Chorismate synthase n=1 Tax=Phaeomonas parva TaxID=124430 RepID=A0A7S1TSX1_9STRA|mmetsp:Transcript_13234/g.39364  ORF Transcript_13234/g.39364 Transcript_13234/m.39364 type:complete len:428 (+) Transcript_13234:130-1413(+)|eukprot:CAMPEP_0118855168 /NCGR_PEP_ID=MMETSP1163-20130328/3100_1 /TAXON_ID=124430 /ORGANISM="Phaeomonas parva, Strain CCMP2877" /LENGTH=427 /DNA_ID=CAMNT_0006788011 /DNA_START=122 /DNA_END=1405 /DNA_ORIENTATION=-
MWHRLLLLLLPAAAFTGIRPSGRRGAGALRMGVGNSFGRIFRISTWGESHGGGVGVTLDGVPPRLPITREEVQFELDRRRPGQSRLTTPRNESDSVEILSGVSPDGYTLGTPIGMLVRNRDQRSQDYDTNAVAYRPSHADAAYDAKYGIRAVAGGGRSSARETIGRVAGGAVAKKLLAVARGTRVLAYVHAVGDVSIPEGAVDHEAVTLDDVEACMTRCPHPPTAEAMIDRIDEVRKSGNSIGGVVECVVQDVPAGLGAPVFEKLEAELAKACMSLPAAKGFEVGSGFEGTKLTGIEHNDPFYIDEDGRTRTRTNRSGGIQGGISNGETIVVRVAFKPTSTIGRVQDTVTREGEEVEMRGKGRHDPCVLPRAAPMVEAMVALTVADALMADHAQCGLLAPEATVKPEHQAKINPLGKKLQAAPTREA